MINITLFDDDNGSKKEFSRFGSEPFNVYPPNDIERFSFMTDSEKFDIFSAVAHAEKVK